MIQNILNDIFDGFKNSLRIDLLISPIIKVPKLEGLIIKIIKYNFILHILPSIFFRVINIIINTICVVNLDFMINIITSSLNIFSSFFHLLHYMDLINIVSKNASKVNKNGKTIDFISLAITMSLYQIIMYMTTNFVYFIFSEKFYYLSLIINFFILSIYHSFYCFNNLWQFMGIDIFYRIDIHERLWAYYLGYGILATIISLFLKNQIFTAIYNIYMIIIISIPFLVDIKYPNLKEYTYPRINLFVFSYVLGFFYYFLKNVINYIKPNSNQIQ